VGFAPRENPRIAIAVMVENAGFGATWAAPIASLMMEKFMYDSISRPELEERMKKGVLIHMQDNSLEKKDDGIDAFYGPSLEEMIPHAPILLNESDAVAADVELEAKEIAMSDFTIENCELPTKSKAPISTPDVTLAMIKCEELRYYFG
jgi:hypothetical protein